MTAVHDGISALVRFGRDGVRLYVGGGWVCTCISLTGVLMSEVFAAMRRRRFFFLAVADACVWVLAYGAFAFIRYLLTDLAPSEAILTADWSRIATAGLFAGVLHVV